MRHVAKLREDTTTGFSFGAYNKPRMHLEHVGQAAALGGDD